VATFHTVMEDSPMEVAAMVMEAILVEELAAEARGWGRGRGLDCRMHRIGLEF
jgi:hypothetical protein